MESNQPNREQLLKMAIEAAKNENKPGARMMLQQVIDEDPKNERAMLWMAKIARNGAEREAWLEKVLKVNPKNDVALQALEKITSKQQAETTQTNLVFGTIGAGVFMFVTLIIAMIWAFAPLS